jgi:hypothetical protein
VPLLDLARAAERRHRTSQAVGLGRREARRDDGDLHRLLLEQGHPQGLAEHGRELLRGEAHGLPALAAAQIGVDHVALDRPRPDDRHLDDEVVEGPGLQPRQHRHLRPALDLEDADRIGGAQHLVDRRILGRDAGEVERDAVM